MAVTINGTTGITTPDVTTESLTTSGDINFGDNDKAIFGADSDLQIYHDPVNGSFISDTGTGNLRLRGANYVILESDTGETFAQGEKDGAFYLYHNNAQKLATTSTGVSVTGTVAATSYTGDGSSLTGVGASTSYNGVGTYFIGGHSSYRDANINAGSTTTGSGLLQQGTVEHFPIKDQRPDSEWESAGLSGTWRAMADMYQPDTGWTPSNIWVRIS